MAKVIHTIKGHQYWYEHTRVGKRVVCKYLGKVGGGCEGGSQRSTDATRVSNSPYTMAYASQDDLDSEVCKAYKLGYGIKRIQRIFEDVDLHPTRRDVENYLANDLGLQLRRRTPKPTPAPKEDIDSELTQAKETISMHKIEQDNKTVRIRQMETVAMQDASRIATLEAKLRDYRDMGRAPTATEYSDIIDSKKKDPGV